MTDSEEVERSKCEKGQVQNENVDGRRKYNFTRLETRTKEIIMALIVERDEMSV